MRTLALLILAALPAFALPVRVQEGDVQALPSLTDANGRLLADGRFVQWREGPLVHVRSTYTFPDGRFIEERAVLRMKPELAQESWSWEETFHGAKVRRYEVDFAARRGRAFRYDEKKSFDEKLDVVDGQTFAGLGFLFAVKNLRGTLEPGKSIDLKAIAFTSTPRLATVEVKRDGPDSVRMAGRTLLTDRYTLHAKLPPGARFFIDPPDQHIWLDRQAPAALVRFEGPQVEPKDQIIRIDTLSTGPAVHGEARRGPGRARR